MNKICTKCGRELPLEMFSLDSSRPDKSHPHCRDCKTANHNKWHRRKRVEYLAVNPPPPSPLQTGIKTCTKCKEALPLNAFAKDRSKLPTGLTSRCKRCRDTLGVRLRVRLNAAVQNGQRAGSAVRDLGCSIGDLKAYLASKFQPGMTWDNHSLHGWHIDHVLPLASFDLTDREQFLKACHYTNLQPLWAEENESKGARV